MTMTNYIARWPDGRSFLVAADSRDQLFWILTDAGDPHDARLSELTLFAGSLYPSLEEIEDEHLLAGEIFFSHCVAALKYRIKQLEGQLGGV